MFEEFYSGEKRGRIIIAPKYNLEVMPYNLIGADTILKENNDFTITKGTKLYDVLEFDEHFCNFAISEKFKTVLDGLNISGWDCFPINIEGITEQYYCFQSIGYIGPILNLDEVNDSLGDLKRQVNFKSWDKSDIFSVERTLLRFCTKRVADEIKKAKITNIIFEEAEGKFDFVENVNNPIKASEKSIYSKVINFFKKTR